MTITKTNRNMISKTKILCAAIFASNLSSIHAFISMPGVDVSHVQQKPTSYSFTLFYNEKSDDTEDCEQSLWLPSSKNTQEERFLKMREDMSRFAEVKTARAELRSDIKHMKETLALSLATDDLMRVVALTNSIQEAQEKDPEFIYSKALERIADAQNVGKYSTKKKYEIITHYSKEAEVAREFIPRFNMHGLWIANFGHGSELVNVTYSGDTLVASRLKHPDSVFFQANLSPREYSKQKGDLGSIRLDNAATTKWGVDKLDRYPGEGLDALNKNPSKADPIEGNLIMFDGYFSFLWIPTRQHVFFSKPKGNRIFELLRDVISEEDELHNMRDHIGRCFDKSIDDAILKPAVAKNEEVPEPFRRIATKDDLVAAKQDTRIVYSDFPIHEFSKKNKDSHDDRQSQSFWAFHKWMHYIDNKLNTGIESNEKQ